MRDIPKATLTEAAGGDMVAFEEIYKATSGFVYSVAYRITNNSEDAKEVAQDVFLKIHKNLGRFQFQSSFKTWVYRITVNTAINAYRKAAKEGHRRVDYDEVIASTPAPTATDEGADKKDAEALLKSLLNVLNPDQRACIVLREIEGLNYQQIAEALNININTVRSRLKRAREMLLAYGRKEVVCNEL